VAKRTVSEWKKVYRDAIEYLGGHVTKRLSLKALKKQWQDIRIEHKRQGIELPKVQQVAKQMEFTYEETPRDEDMNTLPAEDLNLGYEYIENFKSELENIYNNTKAYADAWSDKSLDLEERRHRYLAHTSMELLDGTYSAILTKLDQLVLEYGYDEVANVLASDVELDYSIALAFMPPSTIINQFEMTLEQIDGLITRLAGKYANL